MTMQRIWIAFGSVWALLAIVAALAWSYRPAPALPQAAPQTLVVKGLHGKQQVVVLQPAATGPTHASTHTSGAPR